MENTPSEQVNRPSVPSLEELVRLQESALRELAPVEALGVGGSLGVGTPDEFSDVDFFVLVDHDALFELLGSLNDTLAPPVPVAAVGPWTFVPGFGFQISFILTTGLEVEYFLNSFETLTSELGRPRTVILFDKTGRYSRFLASIPKDPIAHRTNVFRAAAHGLLSELIKLRKLVRRQEWLAASYRIDRMRFSLVALDVFLRNGVPYHPLSSASRVKHLGSSYFDGILNTVPRRPSDPEELLRCADHLRTEILTHLSQHSAATSDFLATETIIWNDCVRALMDQQC